MCLRSNYCLLSSSQTRVIRRAILLLQHSPRTTSAGRSTAIAKTLCSSSHLLQFDETTSLFAFRIALATLVACLELLPMTMARMNTDELLDRVAAGESSAAAKLLTQHRQRLKRMVSLRIDPRLAPRLDPSD